MKLSTKVPPVRLALAVQRIRDHLLRLHQALAPAPAVMGEFITAAWMAQSITVAADLRIADALADEAARDRRTGEQGRMPIRMR